MSGQPRRPERPSRLRAAEMALQQLKGAVPAWWPEEEHPAVAVPGPGDEDYGYVVTCRQHLSKGAAESFGHALLAASELVPELGSVERRDEDE